MRVWRRINKVPGETDRVQVAEIDETLKIKYYTLWGDGTQEEWGTHDLSRIWKMGIESFLSINEGFKEVTNDGLQRIFEDEGSNSSTKRV